MGEPAVLSGQPRARRLTTAGRTIKVLRPVCRQCDTLTPAWWKSCKHNPYIALVPKTYKVPVYEDVMEDREVKVPVYETDDDGKRKKVGETTDIRPVPTGRQKVVGQEEFVEYESRPSWKEVTVNHRIGGMTRLNQALARGCIFPKDLRSPEYPDGIAPPCEFRNCRQQAQPDGSALLVTQFGTYCRVIEAKFAKIDQTGFVDGTKRLEVGFNGPSLEKQRTQLESMSV